MPRPSRRVIPAFALIALGSVALGGGSWDASSAAQRDPFLAKCEAAIFEMVNSHRRSLQLPPLALDERLRALAREHSESMAAGIIPLGHRDFEARIETLGRPYLRAAENAASNRGFVDPAASAVGRWISSPEHRRNIEGDFDLTGAGVAQSANGTYFFTQIFLKKEDRYGVFR
jgi:uncharacterized protein YkwD